MLKPTNCTLLLIALIAFSCQQQSRNEQADEAYWKTKITDSAYHLLYTNRDTIDALMQLDSSIAREDDPTVYPRATRFGILADYHYFFTNDNVATAEMIDSALALFNTEELQDRYPRTYVRYLLFGGQIAYRLSQYNKANEYFFKAKKLADAHLNSCERKAFNYSLAMVLYRQLNFNESLNHFKQAYAQQATCQPQTTAIILQQQEIQSNIGLCFVKLQKYDSAMVHFDRALAIADDFKDSLGAAAIDKIHGVIYGHKAQVCMALNRLKEAEFLSEKSIALNDREGYEKSNALLVKLQLAEIYSRQKDFDEMFRVLDGLHPQIASQTPGIKMEWNGLKASYYEQTGHADSALKYFKMHSLLGDSLTEEQAKLTAADVTRQLKNKEQELQIMGLKKDQHITLISLWVTIVFSSMTLVIIFLVYYTYRRNKKSLADSLALNEEIKRQKRARVKEVEQRHKIITEAVIQAQENERTLIGLELHDNVNQVLTTVKLHNEMVLEGVGEPQVILPRTLKYLQDCINEIRSLSKRLSAPTLGKISLEESVKDLVDSINLTNKVFITREISGLETKALNQAIHLGIYRILQEQLNNVIKHAEASEVKVELRQVGDRLHLCIADNGKGITDHNRKAGIGLMNMQTRAESLNGTFKLNSKPGFGCKVEVELPCAS